MNGEKKTEPVVKLVEKSLEDMNQKYDKDQQVFLTMLAETNIMNKPWEQNYKDFKGMKFKLDDIINDIDNMVQTIIKKQQDNFLIAYHRFLQEVKQELAQLQKDYSVEVLRKQNNEQIQALQRSLEWFKDECLKLSNDVKNKARIIENLRFRNDELVSYKKGYEGGIKDIKRDMLVLKFINKTKTKLLRKYTRKLQDKGKFMDVTDLREPIMSYVVKNQVRINSFHTENLYIKNQLKELASCKKQVTTSHLIDFFLKMIQQRDIQNKGEIKKYREQARIYKSKHNKLSKNMQNYRTTMAHLPKLLYNIVVETMYENGRQNQANNSGTIDASFSAKKLGRSLDTDSYKIATTFDLGQIKIEDKSGSNGLGVKNPDRVSDRVPELRLDEINSKRILDFPLEHRKVVIEKLIKNNLFMAAVAEVISKNDLYNYKRTGSQRSYRSRNSLAGSSSIRNSRGYSKSWITHQKYLASLSFKNKRSDRLNLGSKMTMEDSGDKLEVIPMKRKIKNDVIDNLDISEIKGNDVSADLHSMEKNLLRRQKILRFLLRSKHGRKITKGKFVKGANYGKKSQSRSYSTNH